MKATRAATVSGSSPQEAVPSATPSVEAPNGILRRIQVVSVSLGPAGHRIAEYVAQHARDVIHLSISDVAERTGTSEGSVVGFCKSVGATGFQQLKILLAQEIVQPVHLIL